MGYLECSKQRLFEQLMRFETGNILTIEKNLSCGWCIQTGNGIEQCRELPDR